MIVHDLHVHSVRSACGVHTLLEIVEIASQKRIRTVNISDHGSASGMHVNFGVVSDGRRCPRSMRSRNGREVRVLFGIEVNILSSAGESDYPPESGGGLDLISAGFHRGSAPGLFLAGSPHDNTAALQCYLERHPLDLLTHPCSKKFPLDIELLLRLAVQHGFALEVNNTNLVLDKTDLSQLSKMVVMAHEAGVPLVECSDGHTFVEIGENTAINAFLASIDMGGDELLLNRDDEALTSFLEDRKARRHSAEGDSSLALTVMPAMAQGEGHIG